MPFLLFEGIFMPLAQSCLHYTKKLRCDKMRNVWVLRVYLHDVATADAYCNELSAQPLCAV